VSEIQIAEMKNRLAEIIVNGSLKLNEPMSAHTSFKIGGPADILVEPYDKEELKAVLKLCGELQCPVFVFGNGTNLLVRDKGIRGVVIKIGNAFNHIQVEDEVITAGAGALLAHVSKVAYNNSLTGLEFAIGIPGTVGGAVIMNAGAYGGEIKDVVSKVTAMDRTGAEIIYTKDELKLGYRTSILQENHDIVLGVEMVLQKGEKEKIKAVIDDLNAKRIARQPLNMPSAGSVFRRPAGYYPGALIEKAGLKGYAIGDAQVSEMHAGFIVNKGSATAADVIKLIDFVKETVARKFGIEMETEVKIVGEE